MVQGSWSPRAGCDGGCEAGGHGSEGRAAVSFRSREDASDGQANSELGGAGTNPLRLKFSAIEEADGTWLEGSTLTSGFMFELKRCV